VCAGGASQCEEEDYKDGQHNHDAADDFCTGIFAMSVGRDENGSLVD
jgi:hypothetical protein